jgi:hypothetical protein
MSARFSLNPAVTTSPKDDLAVNQQAQVERFARQQERLPTVCLGQLLRNPFGDLDKSVETSSQSSFPPIYALATAGNRLN